MEEGCFFEWRFNCGGRKPQELSNLTEKRIKTIIKCSKVYDDGIHEKLKIGSHILAHRNCTDSYCHPTNVKKATQHKQSNDQEPTLQYPKKREKRSDIPHFNFCQHCLYCGQVCLTEKNPKNPSRWRPAFVCRQVERADNRSLKQETLDICNERNDKWASEVRVRIAGALSDLHAADARYHVDCRLKFRLTRYTPYADGAKKKTELKDKAFEAVVETMENDQTKIWNSVHLYKMYSDFGGHAVSRRVLVTKLKEHFKHSLITLSSPGIATNLAFKSRTRDIFQIVPDLEDDCDIAISWVKDKICQEIQRIKVDRSKYHISMNLEEIKKKSSDTVLSLLSQLSPSLDNTLPAFLIANMITSVLIDSPTELQITLAVLLRDSKELVRTMNDFGVTCTYDELLRFKRSVAVEAAKNSELTAISNAEDGLVQFVADNFDADISSQNGKLSTHSLAVLMTQPEGNSDQPDQHKVSRLKKTEMTRKIDYKIETMRYNGPKKPKMPSIKYQVLPLKVIAQMAVSTQRANEKDFSFLKKVVQHDDTPEFNGYNTSLCHDEGYPLQPRTKAIYLPLIDMPPAHPDTVMTAMSKAQQMTERTGQKYTLFTVDQQLYKVVVDVKWSYPELYQNVIPRLGGMHLLMSFVGSVGTLMADTGLAEILASTFGGVGKIMTGKKFPMNMRAMRMVAEELLRDTLLRDHVKSQRQLLSELENLVLQSRTTKMWVQNLIKPVLIMMMYVRAEREADWALHLQAVRLMIPYFFASAHVNYARYTLLYLSSMEALPEDVFRNFWQGEHVMRHTQGIWNGIWSDMFIESTFMRYGHGKCGIIGITLKPETMKTWALSLHVCGKLLQELSDIRENASCSSVTKHKEEYASLITADNIDRKSIRSKLDICIHPLKPKDHPKAIVNVVNGRIAPDSVNVDDANAIGMKQMKEFEQNLPEGFYTPISKKVVLMSMGKKAINFGESKVYDIKLIYSRVIGVQASSRDLNFRDVMSCELSPVPTALFDECGDMRISKSKATLKNQTKVEVSTRQTGKQQIEIKHSD